MLAFAETDPVETSAGSVMEMVVSVTTGADALENDSASSGVDVDSASLWTVEVGRVGEGDVDAPTLVTVGPSVLAAPEGGGKAIWPFPLPGVGPGDASLSGAPDSEAVTDEVIKVGANAD